jgi:hypothetical protein
MWFVIRCAFCIGLVFSQVSAPGTTEDAAGAVAEMAKAAAPTLAGGLAPAFAACGAHADLCAAAARLAIGGEDAPSDALAVGDTLTAADRALPWHGGPPLPPRRPADLPASS